MFASILIAATISAGAPVVLETERAAKISEIVTASLIAFDLRPFPVVTLVPKGNKLLNSNELARAVLLESGKEIILVSATNATDKELRDTSDHEIAHLKAWRTYGWDIEAHGREWRATCRASAETPNHACRPNR